MLAARQQPDVHAAVLRAFAGKPPCRLRVIIEGDEEFGGSFEEYPAQHPELFAADAIVIADSGNVKVGQPTFTTSLRGMANVTVNVETMAGPVHSGVFGGPAPDALMVLINLLATLRDASGDTAIAGLTGSQWDGVEVSEDSYREDAGVLPGVPLVGTGSIASRLYSKPAVSVIGIDAPPVAGAINAVVPKARAVVSLRIAPGTDAAEAQRLLVDHLRRHAPWGVEVTVEPGPIGDGFAAPSEGPALAAMTKAMLEVFGEEPVNTGSGGSIPLVSVLTAVAPEAAILLVGAQDGKAALVAGVNGSAMGKVKAGELLSHIAGQIGGKGGGRPDLAQGGGEDGPALATALHGIGQRCDPHRTGIFEAIGAEASARRHAFERCELDQRSLFFGDLASRRLLPSAARADVVAQGS